MNDFVQNINDKQLVTARLLRQKTQKEVSSDTGIPQSSLSKAEHGLKNLPVESFHILCGYYDLPESFFLRKEGPSPVSSLYYRRKIRLSDKIIDSFEAKIKIYKSIIDDIMLAVEIPEYDIASYVPDEDLSTTEIAKKTRYGFGIFCGAVPNLTMLLENRGVIVINFDFGTDKIDGLTTVTAHNRKVIFINRRMPNDRIRFSLAHELGHLVMHMEQPPVYPEDEDLQANEFASEFLMPEDEIRPMLGGLDLSTLAILKRRWRVSMRAIIRRALDLNVINRQQYRNFQIIFSKRGFNKNEPIPLPTERPTLWNETLKLYHDELGYSDKDLMEVMCLNENDYNSWFKPERKISFSIGFPKNHFISQ